MTFAVRIAIVLLGAAVSLVASGVLVSRIERLAHRLSLTEAALGLLAALAADAPEITSSIAALVHHDTSVGIGVVVGSNIFNIAALIGLAALVAGPLALHRPVAALEGVPAIAIAGVSALALARVIAAPVALALVLLVTLAVVILALLGPARVGRRLAIERYLSGALGEEELELHDVLGPRSPRRGDAVLAVLALVMVVGASVAMEQAAVELGRRAGIPDFVVGGVVLAAVTSIPNVVAALYLARRRRPAALLAEASNSNTLNVVFGLALPSVLIGTGPLGPADGAVGLWYVALTVAAYAGVVAQRGLRRSLGAAVIVVYAGFVLYAIGR